MIAGETGSLLRILRIFVQQHDVALSMSRGQNHFYILGIARKPPRTLSFQLNLTLAAGSNISLHTSLSSVLPSYRMVNKVRCWKTSIALQGKVANSMASSNVNSSGFLTSLTALRCRRRLDLKHSSADMEVREPTRFPVICWLLSCE